MIKHIANKEFASMAEARAFYLEQGYVTSDEGEDSYLMVRRNHPTLQNGEVIINKEGFLLVVAEEILVY